MGLLSTKEKASGIRNVFMDPKGWHVFIVGDNSNSYYLNHRDSKPRALTNLKGVNVKAVTFHGSNNNEYKSGDILVAL